MIPETPRDCDVRITVDLNNQRIIIYHPSGAITESHFCRRDFPSDAAYWARIGQCLTEISLTEIAAEARC